MKVEVETQVISFVRSLAPDPRKAVRRALFRLQREAGDIRPLEGDLGAFIACVSFDIALFFTTLCEAHDAPSVASMRRREASSTMYLRKHFGTCWTNGD